MLIIDSFGRDIGPFNAVAAAFRTTLTRGFAEPVDVDEAPFDTARFTEPKQEAPFVDFLQNRYGGRKTLAYGLYGDKLFADYEQRFLKRNVQGEIIARALSPLYWGKLSSTGWGRSELAAELYDEVLFNGATFGDLDRGDGPMIMTSATDISSGARFIFHQTLFDFICSDLNAVPLSRAAAASSAVPVVLSPVTINNYGGTCNTAFPSWAKLFTDSADPPRPAERAIRSLKDAEEAFGDSIRRPYIHLVDGGVADNVGMRGVLDALEILEALHEAGVPTQLNSAHRIIVFVVNSLSSPPSNWDESENAPGTAGNPAEGDRCSDRPLFLRFGGAFERHGGAVAGPAPNPGIGFYQAQRNPAVANLLRVPNAEIYAIDVSFPALKDKAERDYLNQQPTSFVLPAEAVDRLRAAAGTIILSSPEFQRLLKDVGAKLTAGPAAPASAPIKETVEKVYDNLDLIHGVETAD